MRAKEVLLAASIDFAAGLGLAWMFGLRDQVVAVQLALTGKLDVGNWFASLARTRSFASFSLSDPLPWLLEMPLTVWRIIARNLGGSR